MKKQQNGNEKDNVPKGKRGRGPAKPFPSMELEEVLVLSKHIVDAGVNGSMKRQRVMEDLNLSPNSQKARDLVTNSSKYGLTSGGYNAEYLKITDETKYAFVSQSDEHFKSVWFSFAIAKFESFSNLYDEIKERSLPKSTVLQDELEKLGIPNKDSLRTVQIFIANLKYLNLIKDNIVTPIEQDDEAPTNDSMQKPTSENPSDVVRPVTSSPLTYPNGEITVKEPSVHIDIQIHIDSSATPEQIDRIFANMAQHLYAQKG